MVQSRPSIHVWNAHSSRLLRSFSSSRRSTTPTRSIVIGQRYSNDGGYPQLATFSPILSKHTLQVIKRNLTFCQLLRSRVFNKSILEPSRGRLPQEDFNGPCMIKESAFLDLLNHLGAKLVPQKQMEFQLKISTCD